MVLYLIGIGLGNYQDITVEALEYLQTCSKLYLENYTSVILSSTDDLAINLKRTIEIADRELIEEKLEQILDFSITGNVGILVVGDPLSATTHVDLLLRSAELNIPFKVINNASIMNAISSIGLLLERFGETVSIVTWTDKWKPDSFLPRILDNYSNNLHTLCLMDIKINEFNIESLLKLLLSLKSKYRGKKLKDPPFFLNAQKAACFIYEANMNNSNLSTIRLNDEAICVVGSQVGCEKERFTTILFKSLCNLVDEELHILGATLHSLIICAYYITPNEADFLLNNTNIYDLVLETKLKKFLKDQH